MYYVTKQKGNHTYASAAKSIRDGKTTRIEYIYLGRVVDIEKGIFFSKERQYFVFDICTGEYSKVGEAFETPKTTDKRQYNRCALDFGDAYLLDHNHLGFYRYATDSV